MWPEPDSFYKPMCARSHGEQASVRDASSLQALNLYLATLDPDTRRRGKKYFDEGRVVDAVATYDESSVEAEVQGGKTYAVTLLFDRGSWGSFCTCPMETECKHAVAVGLAWIAQSGSDLEFPSGVDHALHSVTTTTSEAGLPPPHSALSAAHIAKSPAPKKISFRDQWSPVLAEKLGRPLAPDELRLIGQLSALFTNFAQRYYTLYESDLRNHGFADAIPPGNHNYSPLFTGWWTHDDPPRDPWAFWQYLAYSLEQQGRPVPNVFRPLTDTTRVHASLDAFLNQQQVHAWRVALNSPSELGQLSHAPPLFDPDSSLRARLDDDGRLFIETRSAPDKSWKTPPARWLNAIMQAGPADFECLPPAEAALAVAFALTSRRSHLNGSDLKRALPAELTAGLFATRGAYPAIILPDGRHFAVEPLPLAAEALPSESARDRLEVRLVTPDGAPAPAARLIAVAPAPLYYHAGRVWPGPPPLPRQPLPTAALRDPQIMARLRAHGVRLPASFEAKFQRVALRPLLKLWLTETADNYSTQFHAQLFARATDPACTREWRGQGGWQWTKNSAPPPRRPDDPILEFDLDAANAVGARFADFRLGWHDWHGAWTKTATKNFPEEFLEWHATLPHGLDIDATPALAGFFGAPLRATVDFSAIPADSGHDWFDLTVALRVEDSTLAPDEIALLLKARGKWVRLPRGGWRRLELSGPASDAPATAALDRLGLSAAEVFASGQPATHRLHALQLATEATALEAGDAQLAADLRTRAARLAALPPSPLPAGLTATLRPYQHEGFHFLAHLSAHGFGGILADDMGLGKTVQTLTWLLHLAAVPPAPAKKKSRPRPFRALIVCPKSVVHGWLAETARFAPSLTAQAFAGSLADTRLSTLSSHLLVLNYTQLRLNADWLRSEPWDAIVLDEGQNIKNPSSQAALAARALVTRHRLVLTGTPVENRLTDLWSLFAFAQPGLLGTLAAFRRQYDEKAPAALGRLHRRVRHFLLRRTKAQAAPELPARTEDELVVELEPAQRRLYDAELKRARAQLLGIETARALDAVRFNVLASLLRLRQICCHPALVDPAHAELPSAKLDALLERVAELHEESHQVLVFSQFVEMLNLIRERLVAAGIGHLLLTGQTENRRELVDQFQSDKTKTVFLLSLKAAGSGLNLTAASYVILCDPWWNPAVEAQAIDRTHRIGQTQPVVAYRLVAADTVEQKILAMQKDKAALANAVVQEESLASVLDLDSLREILG